MGYVSEGISRLGKAAAIVCASTLLAPAGLNAKSYPAHQGDMAAYTGEPTASPDRVFKDDETLKLVSSVWKKYQPLLVPLEKPTKDGISTYETTLDVNGDGIQEMVKIRLVIEDGFMSGGADLEYGKQIAIDFNGIAGQNGASTVLAIIGSGGKASVARTVWFNDSKLPGFLTELDNAIK